MDQYDETTSAPPHPPVEPGGTIPDELSVGRVFGDAHEVLKSNYGIILGAILVMAVFVLVVSLASAAIDSMIVGKDAIIQPVSMFTSLFVLSPLYVGPGMLAAMRYRSGKGDRTHSGSLETLFIGYTRYPTVLGITAIIAAINWGMMILVGLIALGANAAAGAGGAIAVGLLLGLPTYVIMIYVYIRLGYATLLAVDPMGVRPGAIDAMKLSWHLTSGRAWMLFAIGLLLGVIVLITMLLLVLPALFYGIPLAMCGGGVMYMIVARDHLERSAGDGSDTPAGIDDRSDL